MLVTFRDTLLRLCPRWLREGHVGAVLYAIGLHFDIFGDAVIAAVRKRFPEVDSEDAAAVMGRARKIVRGRDEPWTTYAKRLRLWLDHHPRRGGPYALIEQLIAFWAATPFEIGLYYAGANRTAFGCYPGSPIVRSTGSWYPPGYETRWARWLLLFAWPTALPPRDHWGDPGLTWGAGKVWGSGLDAQTVADIRRVPQQWSNAHTRGQIRLTDSLGTVAPISLD